MAKFTDDELKIIWENSKNFDYTKGFNFFGADRLSILKQDFKSKLLLVRGDDDTGFEHILNRHFGSEMKPYFEAGERNPTIFKGEIVPLDLLDYAGQLYHREFCVPNKFETPFIKYEKDIAYEKNGTPLKSRLLIYKDFPIIHTFYICDKLAKNKNKLKDFVRSTYRVIENMQSGDITFSCSFYATPQQKCFSLIVDINHFMNIGKAKIRLTDNEKEIPLDLDDQIVLKCYGKYIGMIVFDKLNLDLKGANEIEVLASQVFKKALKKV